MPLRMLLNLPLKILVKTRSTMWNKYLSFSVLIGITLTANSAMSAVDEANQYKVSHLSAEQAYMTGSLLRAQYKSMDSMAYLKHAADQNHAPASYLYSMELASRRGLMNDPLAAREYLLKAAKLGHRKAMHELYLNANWLRDIEIDYWKKQYHSQVILLGREAPSQAMYELSRFYQESDSHLSEFYLNKAADLNHPLALMAKARKVTEGGGSVLVSLSREALVNQLYLEAAKTNYIPAIRKYIDILESKKRYKEAFKWRVIALENGDITSLASVAKILLGESKLYQFVPQDRVKAKAYIDLYLASAGQEKMQTLYTSLAQKKEKIELEMIAEEKQNAKEMYLNFKNTLSFYNHDRLWDVQYY